MIAVLIVGSRSYTNYTEFCQVMDYLLKNHTPDNIQFISGGAKGADTLAEKYAKERGISIQVIPAEWDKYGKKAGYIRNRAMHEALAEYENRHVVAFWDGKSKGTAQNFELAEEFHNPIRVYNFNEHLFVSPPKTIEKIAPDIAEEVEDKDGITNAEVFRQYGSEQWVIEQNLGFLLHEYWDACREKYGSVDLKFSQPPINLVSFVKDFMKQESFCDVKYAELSKMNTIEKSEIVDAKCTEVEEPTKNDGWVNFAEELKEELEEEPERD